MSMEAAAALTSIKTWVVVATGNDMPLSGSQTAQQANALADKINNLVGIDVVKVVGPIPTNPKYGRMSDLTVFKAVLLASVEAAGLVHTLEDVSALVDA